MQCKKCGYRNDRIWYEPVIPQNYALFPSDDPPNNLVFYKRWACEACKRYHFPDGSLYSNPFKKEAT